MKLTVMLLLGCLLDVVFSNQLKTLKDRKGLADKDSNNISLKHQDIFDYDVNVNVNSPKHMIMHSSEENLKPRNKRAKNSYYQNIQTRANCIRPPRKPICPRRSKHICN